MNAFSNLKLRGSWDVTGNQAIASYSTLGLLNSQQYWYGTATAYQGFTLVNPLNSNLKWETTSQWTSALTLDFRQQDQFHDRLFFQTYQRSIVAEDH